jgi:hypothetical protein
MGVKKSFIAPMKIHLVIVQPDNYVHSLGFLDTADYMLYWLKQEGLQVTVAKNRLRHDAINLVFGAHLGFLPQWLEAPYCTYFFNLEQVGHGGAQLSPAYHALLKSGPVIDYHPENVVSYRNDAASVPLIPFLNAPYLNPDLSTVSLLDRPIDLLFFGSINAERKAFLQRIEKLGLDVGVFDSPTYYQERDAYVRQAKAVINTSFYASARFEQVRAFNVLSQGTAFISYLQPGQKIDEDFRDPVFWIDDQSFDVFFKEQFGKEPWCQEAQQKYSRWQKTQPQQAINQLIEVLSERWQRHLRNQQSPHQPNQLIQAGDGRYFQDALNLSAHAVDEADLTMDLCASQTWPWSGLSRWGQPLHIDAHKIEQIVFRHSPENTEQWRNLFFNAMQLLSDEGRLVIELSMEQLDISSDKGPQLQSAHEVLDSFTNRFWRSGSWEHRFDLFQSVYVDAHGKICSRSQAIGGRVVLKKRVTTSKERTMARVASPSFGRFN